MSTLITVLHVIVCLFLMLTVLLQSGKGGGMGAAFGGGNAATVFGGSGASGFLKRLTAIAGTIFMITSMVLAFLSSRNSADALDSYGKEQGKIAQEKEEAKARALKAAKQGGGSGSGVMINPLAPGSNAPTSMTPLPPSGSDTPKAGSATTPVPGNPDALPDGSASAPVEKPAAPAEKPVEKPAAPAEKPAGSAAKPAEKPAAPLKPLTPAPTGSGSNK